METSSQNYPADIQTKIDAHLDAIDRVLSDSGTPLTERLSITNEVEHLIRESLQQHTNGQPTVADIEAVLMDLDPPESYGETKRTPQPQLPNTPIYKSKPVAGILSIALSSINFVSLVLLIIVAGLEETPLQHGTIELLALLVMLVFAIACICGIAGWRSGWGKAGTAFSGICLATMLIYYVMPISSDIPDYGDQYEELQDNDPPEMIPTRP